MPVERRGPLNTACCLVFYGRHSSVSTWSPTVVRGLTGSVHRSGAAALAAVGTGRSSGVPIRRGRTPQTRQKEPTVPAGGYDDHRSGNRAGAPSKGRWGAAKSRAGSRTRSDVQDSRPSITRPLSGSGASWGTTQEWRCRLANETGHNGSSWRSRVPGLATWNDHAHQARGRSYAQREPERSDVIGRRGLPHATIGPGSQAPAP